MESNNIFNQIIENEFFQKNPNNVDIFLKYITARIDIKNFGNKDNDICILENSDINSIVDAPAWYTTSEGIGTIIHSKKGSIDLKFKCINEGKLEIYLKGIDFRDKIGQRVPIYINFTKFHINGESIFDSKISVSHDKYYNYSKNNVKDGEIIDMHIEWEPFDSKGVYRG